MNLKPIQLPFPIRVWNSLGQVISSNAELSADELLTEAKRIEKLDDYGDDYFVEPLERLLESVNKEANLHAFGRYVIRQRIIGLLRNRLRAEYYFKKHPEILDLKLDPPIVIAGLQRTGTTFLQRLLASQPEVRSLKSWEALNPAPYQTRMSNRPDKRIKEGRKAEKGLKYLNPAFFVIHPVEFDAPEEEVLLLDISFLSTVAEATMHVPSFASWLEKQDQTPAYNYMKKLLQLLMWQKPARKWVLKTPHHLEFLDTLISVFPGSTIVQTHRDPSVTVPSLCSMIWHGRFIFSREVNPHLIGEQWLRKIEIMLRKSSEFRASVGIDNFIDIKYEDLIKSPAEQVSRVLQKASMNYNRSKLDDVLSRSTRNKYGTHQYRSEDFGLSDQKIRDRLAPYIK